MEPGRGKVTYTASHGAFCNEWLRHVSPPNVPKRAQKNPAPSLSSSVMNLPSAPRLKGAGQCHHSRSFEDAGRSYVFAGDMGATLAPESRLLYSVGYPTYGYCLSGDNRNIDSAIWKDKR